MVRRQGGKQVEYSRIFQFSRVASPSGNRRGIPHPTPCREPARNHHPLPFPPGTEPATTCSFGPSRAQSHCPCKHRLDCHWRCGCHSATTQGNGRPPISDAVLRHPGPRRAGTAHPTPPRTWEIASFSPDNSLSWHGISMRPEGPWLPDSPKKQCKAWRCPGRNRSPNGSVWRDPLFVLLCKSRRLHAPLGRCSAGKTKGGAASCRALADGGREGKKTNRAKADKIAAGKREVEIYKTVPNAAPRTRMPGRG